MVQVAKPQLNLVHPIGLSDISVRLHEWVPKPLGFGRQDGGVKG